MKIKIKEPSDKEFISFKRQYLIKKSKEYYDQDTKKEIQTLLFRIGQLESYCEELKHKILKREVELNGIGNLPVIRRKTGRLEFKAYISSLLNESLFYELKHGNFYN